MSRRSGKTWHPPHRAEAPESPTPPADQEQAPEFSAKIESGVAGVIRFFADGGRILWSMIASPRGCHRLLGDAAGPGRSVPPYTFLALSTFFAVRAIRAVLATLMLLALALDRSCSSVTQPDVEFPKLVEQLRIPSLEEVLGIGLPSVLLILLLLALFRRLLSNGVMTQPQTQAFYRIASYIVGFQYLLFTLAAAVILGSFDIPAGAAAENYASRFGVYALGLLAVAWPALLFALQFGNMIPQQASRLRRGGVAGRVAEALAAVLLSAATLCVGVLLSYPLARKDVAPQQAAPAVAEAVLLQPVNDAGGVTRLSLLLSNHSGATLLLSPRSITVDWAKGMPGTLKGSGEITAWSEAGAPLLSIRAGESAWLSATLTAPLPTGADAGTCALSSPFSQPSETSAGRVCLRRLLPSGETQTLVANLAQAAP